MRLPDLTGPTVDAVRTAQTYLTDLVTPTVRLGVTGLSRAGKTVFITALVRSLISGSASPALPTSKLGGFRAYLEPQPDDDLPRFEYERHLGALASEPVQWPESTRRISQLRLTLEWTAQDWARRTAGVDRRLHIDIVDYPGEWLLDLALLDQSYSQWSLSVLQGIDGRTRDGRLESWIAFLAKCDPKAQDAEQIAIEGAERFTAFLASMRDNDTYARTITPGRFLMPGDLAGSPLLSFFPLRVTDEHVAPQGSLAALLERRYESYKAQVVQPFFERHFQSLDRQIVLVDALSALNGGAEAVIELEKAMDGALTAFRPGMKSWLSALLGRRIDRVMFAATKADHIHRSSYPRLEKLVRTIVDRAAQRAQTAGADISVAALASLRSTEDVEHRSGETVIPCIRGRPMAGETVAGKTFDGVTTTAIFPGDLPADPLDIFDNDRLAPGAMGFVQFQPRKMSADDRPWGAAEPWPHIGLDRFVRFLIGDYIA